MDAKTILEQMLRSGQELLGQGREVAEKSLNVPQQGAERDAMMSGLGKGAIAGGLLGLLLGTGSGRRLTGTLLKLGGVAAIGTVAYTAYQRWQSSQPGAASDPGTPAGELTGSDADKRSLLLLKAMIAAARADGHIDDDERERIGQQFDRLGIADDLKTLLQQELNKPLDPREFAALVDAPEIAAEVYLASLLIIDVDNPMERSYLQNLADALKLPADLVAQIESDIAA